MTNRQAHEAAAGMGLEDMFFSVTGIDPDAEYIPPPGCMPVSLFVCEEKKELDDFLKYWTACHAEDSEHFPLEMLPGEWTEQFLAFTCMHPDERVPPKPGQEW